MQNPVHDLIKDMQQSGAGPRITWYGGGERIELSGATLENWVVKYANLWSFEAGLAPSQTLALDLPWHWKSVAALLGAWLAGLNVQVGPGIDADAVITSAPQNLADDFAGDVFVLDMRSLAVRFLGELPVLAVDATEAVRGMSDDLMFTPPQLDSQRVAGVDIARAFAAKGLPGRYACIGNWDTALESLVRILASGGSVVMSDSELSETTLNSENAQLLG